MNKKIYYILTLIFIVIGISIFFASKDKIENPVKIDMCENITSGKLKVVCYSMFLKDHTHCKLAGDFSTYCYDSVFPLIELNKTFCESFNENYAKLSCFTNLAIKSRDATVCEMIGEPAVVDVCYTNLFDYLDYFTGLGLCENIPHESTRFACLAKDTNNITKCEEITQEVEEKGVCLGMLTKNVSHCIIESPDALSRITIYSCIKNIAIETENMTLCDSIDYEEAKWKCKTYLAEDISICNYAENPWDDFCKLEYIKNNLV